MEKSKPETQLTEQQFPVITTSIKISESGTEKQIKEQPIIRLTIINYSRRMIPRCNSGGLHFTIPTTLYKSSFFT